METNASGHEPSSSRVRELDGLRGVAVLAVMAFHASESMLQGGWLGVDVFFGLSGYLITALLVTEHRRTGRIDLPAFYLRRLLRLLPALVTLVAVCAFVRLLADPTAAAEVGKSVGVVLLYVANWSRALGWSVDLGVFAHTWSLSIEEQFYLLWPPMLIVLLRSGLRPRGCALIAIGLAVAVAITRSALFTSGSEVVRLYNGLDTRADSLLLGSAAAFVRSTPTKSNGARVILAATGTLGALSLAVLFLLLRWTSDVAYAGGLTFVACVTSLLVLLVARGETWFLGRLLRWRFLVWIGTISYGLYLWHYVIYKALPPPEGWRVRHVFPAHLALTFGAAAASYYAIERPFLRLKERFARASLASPPSSPRGVLAPLDSA